MPFVQFVVIRPQEEIFVATWKGPSMARAPRYGTDVGTGCSRTFIRLSGRARHERKSCKIWPL